ncbi:MAG: type VI secretion system tip protein TssI/VgrG [Planctomycetota bacterium]|nr:type VI secretion system tip protein TssI/VgrG [Planctomycetota bacterium]
MTEAHATKLFAPESNMPKTATIRLKGDAIQPDDFVVLELAGRDAIGELFNFDLLLETKRDDWDLGQLLREACVLEFAQGVLLPGTSNAGMTMLPIHGVLSEVKQLNRRDDRYLYRARFVPAVWRLGLGFGTRTFLELSVPEIIKQVLTDRDIPADGFELRLQGTYPKRAVVNQYQESDLDFIFRLCEHDGIAGMFEHNDEGTTWVFCDNGEAYAEVPADPTLPYRPDSAGWDGDGAFGGSWFEPPQVRRVTCAQQVVTGTVVLQDYLYERPDLDLRSEQEVNVDAAFGTRYEYGVNYDSPESGKAYARIRSEEIACREKRYEGTTNSRALRAGAWFSLAEHFRDAFNQEFLIVAVEHKATGSADQMAYGCHFDAIPRATPFRPMRRTSKPTVTGVLPAKVDAAGDGQYAEVDDHGSYRVKFPFDLSDAKDGKASAPLRMGQAYGGAGMGMHFPLHKDTEVSVGFIHGDPDRPYISQTLPNPKTPSEITASNQTGCALRSGGGNSMVLDDTDGAQKLDVTASYDRSLTVAHDNVENIANNETRSVAVDRSTSVGSNQSATIGADDSLSVGGKQTVQIAGDRSTSVGGSDTTTVASDSTINLGASLSTTVASNATTNVGSNATTTIGGSDTTTIGGASALSVGGAFSQTVNGNLSQNAGGAVSVSAASTISTTAGASVAIDAPTITLNGAGGITLSAGGATIELGPAGIKISAPTITINGAGMVDIKGGVVKNNA